MSINLKQVLEGVRYIVNILPDTLHRNSFYFYSFYKINRREIKKRGSGPPTLIGPSELAHGRD
jgi:hypothetical protein